MVLSKGVYCEYKYGFTRAEVERKIGRRREQLTYVEDLAQVCAEGLRDISHFPNWLEGICVSIKCVPKV